MTESLQLTEFEKIFGTNQKTVNGLNNELYLPIEPFKLVETINKLYGNSFELVSMFCVQNFGKEGFTLFYVFEKEGFKELPVLQVHLDGNQAESIAKTYASACWYEREITDGFGVEFNGAYDKRRLFLHETYPKDFHPLLKTFKKGPIKTVPPKTGKAEEYQFKQLHGEGVYQIPVGPVHAGIIEPGHFRFSVIGETIFNLEVRMFYKHRGLEKLAEGKTPLECVKIAETISGDETVANSVAYCNAVEKIAGISVPLRALQLRTIFMELERIYSYLGDISGMILDVAYPVGASSFFILREELLRFNEMLTGSRFMKGIITIGGLTKDVPEQALKNLNLYLQAFSKGFKTAKDLDNTYFSLIDRFETTGIVNPELLAPLHITGPIARASSRMIDTRINHPYGLYGVLNLKGRTQQHGDVLSRFELKAQEILDSVKMILDLLNHLTLGEVLMEFEICDGYALSLVESARGQSMHWVYIKNGLIDRYKVRTASFCNWQAIEHAVLGNIVPDFPLINKSMNLSYAGTDL
ncbi:MAG: NADH-quinone oxidoreductase subunit C [Candidatus Bathyarchaeia archaeon]|jgi:Ni,Fe-hydrogenase III large subunit/Ni,Fe-hydrogenase III component G